MNTLLYKHLIKWLPLATSFFCSHEQLLFTIIIFAYADWITGTLADWRLAARSETPLTEWWDNYGFFKKVLRIMLYVIVLFIGALLDPFLQAYAEFPLFKLLAFVILSLEAWSILGNLAVLSGLPVAKKSFCECIVSVFNKKKTKMADLDSKAYYEHIRKAAEHVKNILHQQHHATPATQCNKSNKTDCKRIERSTLTETPLQYLRAYTPSRLKAISDYIEHSGYVFEVCLPCGKKCHKYTYQDIQILFGDLESYLKKIVKQDEQESIRFDLFAKNGSSFKRKGAILFYINRNDILPEILSPEQQQKQQTATKATDNNKQQQKQQTATKATNSNKSNKTD